MTMFGLMTVEAHEAAMRSADAKAYEAWSKAIDERNAANAEIEKRKSEYDSLRRDYDSLRRDYDTRGDLLAKAREEANALRPDAEAMRAKRKRDREQKAAKKGEIGREHVG